MSGPSEEDYRRASRLVAEAAAAAARILEFSDDRAAALIHRFSETLVSVAFGPPPTCDAEYDYDAMAGENIGFALCDLPPGHDGPHVDRQRQHEWTDPEETNP